VVNEKFCFSPSVRSQILDENLKRLIAIGASFVIFDIEKCIRDGIINEQDDVITITTSFDTYGYWGFLRKELERLIEKSYEGKTRGTY
jgi:hypothetical protein